MTTLIARMRGGRCSPLQRIEAAVCRWARFRAAVRLRRARLPGTRSTSQPEQVAELGAGVFAGLQQRDHVGFLPGIQFGLLAP